MQLSEHMDETDFFKLFSHLFISFHTLLILVKKTALMLFCVRLQFRPIEAYTLICSIDF